MKDHDKVWKHKEARKYWELKAIYNKDIPDRIDDWKRKEERSKNRNKMGVCKHCKKELSIV